MRRALIGYVVLDVTAEAVGRVVGTRQVVAHSLCALARKLTIGNGKWIKVGPSGRAHPVKKDASDPAHFLAEGSRMERERQKGAFYGASSEDSARHKLAGINA